MGKIENVIRYYLLCNTLKDIVRTGWQIWNVKKERVESIAEHIYGVQMLAIAMHSEFNYEGLDLRKVLMMLAVHELEEITIGDKCWYEISEVDKQAEGHKAITKLLSILSNGQEIIDLILEFDACETREAIFAYNCDKLECDLQAKIYDEEDRVDINNQEGNPAMQKQVVIDLLLSEGSFSGYWLEFDKRRIDFDSNFEQVLVYAQNNRITDLINK
jgi:putative hydrolase of HD superfamily